MWGEGEKDCRKVEGDCQVIIDTFCCERASGLLRWLNESGNVVFKKEVVQLCKERKEGRFVMLCWENISVGNRDQGFRNNLLPRHTELSRTLENNFPSYQLDIFFVFFSQYSCKRNKLFQDDCMYTCL